MSRSSGQPEGRAHNVCGAGAASHELGPTTLAVIENMRDDGAAKEHRLHPRRKRCLRS
jgi:hypothetical protein